MHNNKDSVQVIDAPIYVYMHVYIVYSHNNIALGSSMLYNTYIYTYIQCILLLEATFRRSTPGHEPAQPILGHLPTAHLILSFDAEELLNEPPAIGIEARLGSRRIGVGVELLELRMHVGEEAVAEAPGGEEAGAGLCPVPLNALIAA